MFIGHFGLGLGAKNVAPALSLGTLLLAAQFVDLLWPIFLLLGWEQVAISPGMTAVNSLDFISYPISHSLLTGIGWGALLGLAYYLIRKNRRGAWVVGALVVSHWLLDLVVHRPDLPLYPGSDILLGWGLWNSIPATLIVEGVLFVGGLYLYLRSTTAIDRIGQVLIWVLAVSLVLIYAANFLGPQPEDVGAIAWAGHLQWLFVGLGYWTDAHRRAV